MGAMGTDELVKEATLAHSGLPNNRHELPVASPGLLQGPTDGLELLLTPHKGSKLTGRKRLQTCSSRRGARKLKDLHRI